MIEIKAAPKIKIIIITDSTDELNNMIEHGWKIASNFPHASGALFMMAKD